MTHSFFSAVINGIPDSFAVEDDEYLTVPDMSLTVQEIISRFTRGTISLDSYDNGLSYTDDRFIDDPSFDNIEDLSDIDNLQDFNSHKLRSVIDGIKSEEATLDKVNIDSNDVNFSKSEESGA